MAFFYHYYYYLSVVLVFSPITTLASDGKCFLVNFGDSNSDTGTGCAAFGYPVAPPPVLLFPGHETSCRLSNGRLYLDFLCEYLGIKYLSPYLESVGSDYTNGVNFAVSNAVAYSDKNTTFPFPLEVQVKQCAHFINRTKMLTRQGPRPRLKDRLRKAIFSMDIGHNDLSIAPFLSHEVVTEQLIPNILGKIENATKTLYELGGRKFLVYNCGPLGCLPSNLQWNVSGVDKAGCRVDLNGVVRSFNRRLSSLCAKLRTQMKEATIIYMDIYSVKYELTANPSEYGFEHPLVQCYVREKSTVCVDPSRAISWDGSHYTDAANKIVARKIWSGEYSHPHNMTISELCDLVV